VQRGERYIDIAVENITTWQYQLTLTQRARSEEEAYKQTVECITGPISKLISTKGMPAVYEALDDHGKEVFKKVRVAELLRMWLLNVMCGNAASSIPTTCVHKHTCICCTSDTASHLFGFLKFTV